MKKLKLDPETLVGVPYDEQNFNCWTLIEKCLNVPTLKEVSVATALNDVKKYEKLFKKIDTPENDCLVKMGESHIGIYFCGGVYHADFPSVRWQTLRNIVKKYKKVEYYDFCQK